MRLLTESASATQHVLCHVHTRSESVQSHRLAVCLKQWNHESTKETIQHASESVSPLIPAADENGHLAANGHLRPTISYADMLNNEFFARISTGAPVDPGVYHSGSLHSSSDISEYEIERRLRYTKRTSTGWDGLPSWLFRKCSVTPVPKLTQPSDCGDYRPISVTPILSRITEKIVVESWLRTSVPTALLPNQYGFIPTGSTTAALVHLFHTIVLPGCLKFVAMLEPC